MLENNGKKSCIQEMGRKMCACDQVSLSFGISRLDCDQDKLDVQKKQIKWLMDQWINE